MDDQLRWAIRGVLARGPAGVLEIAAEVDADPAEVQRVLEELKEEGEVGRRPPGPEYPRAEDI